MILEGDTSVIDAIKEKKRLIDAGEAHEHIKPMIFVDGGLMKGVYGAGAVVALEELGYSTAFHTAIGVSSGAPTVAYFLAQQAREGVSLYYEESCSRAFINGWRFWNQVNTMYFAGALRGVTGKGLNANRVLATNTELYIAVSDFVTASPKLLEPKTTEELFTAIQASILMPNVSSDIVKFKDIRYVDGGFTRPHALRLAIDAVDATHILVITNQDKSITTLPWLERFLNHTLYRHRMPKPLRFAAHERKRERIKAIEYLEKEFKTPYALVWGDGRINSFERNPEIVKSVVEASRQWWRALLA